MTTATPLKWESKKEQPKEGNSCFSQRPWLWTLHQGFLRLASHSAHSLAQDPFQLFSIANDPQKTPTALSASQTGSSGKRRRGKIPTQKLGSPAVPPLAAQRCKMWGRGGRRGNERGQKLSVDGGQLATLAPHPPSVYFSPPPFPGR